MHAALESEKESKYIDNVTGRSYNLNIRCDRVVIMAREEDRQCPTKHFSTCRRTDEN